MPIRAATLVDVEAMFEIRSNEPQLFIGDDSPATELVRWEHAVSEGTGCCLVYETDSCISGFIYAAQSEDGKSVGRIRYLWVHPEQRRRNVAGKVIANELYERCEAELIGKGYEAIRFATAIDNHVVHNMAKKYGFKPVGVRLSGENGDSLSFYEKVLK